MVRRCYIAALAVSGSRVAASVMRQGFFESALALALMLMGAAVASANPDGNSAGYSVDVEWTAPPRCPDQDAFAGLVRDSVAVPPRGAVRIRALVTARRGQFHLELHIHSDEASGVRSFSAPNCTDLARTAALIVALAVQPAEGPDRTEPGPEAGEPVTGVPAAGAAAARRMDDRRMDDSEWPRPIDLGDLGDLGGQGSGARDPRRGLAVFGLPFDVAVRLMVGGDSGVLPGFAPSMHAVLGAQYDRWRLEVGGSYVFEQRAPMPSDPDTGGLISVAAAALRTCAEIFRGPALASLCGGGELGVFRSTGYGNIMPISRSQTHAALSSGASLAVKVRDSIYIRLDASAAAMLVRPRFAICRVGSAEDCAVPLETLWQPEQVLGRVQAGVEMFFQ
jgi:hypothetical protein